MDKKTNLPDRKRNWKITLALLSTGTVLLAAVFGSKVGGESGDLSLTEALLTYAATAALVLAFVYHWRRARKFLILAATSVAGFFLFAVLENLSYALGQMTAEGSLMALFRGFLPWIFLLYRGSYLSSGPFRGRSGRPCPGGCELQEAEDCRTPRPRIACNFGNGSYNSQTLAISVEVNHGREFTAGDS